MLPPYLKDLPNKWHCPLVVAHVFGDWAVETLGGKSMHSGPAVLAVILEAAYGATVEGGKLPVTLDTMALIAHLVEFHIWLHFHLQCAQLDKDLQDI